jgi:hypothetical protein
MVVTRNGVLLPHACSFLDKEWTFAYITKTAPAQNDKDDRQVIVDARMVIDNIGGKQGQ